MKPLKEVLNQLSPNKAKLVAISKTRTVDQILDIYHQGHKTFGENKVQELLPKHEALPKDIEWHFIGHLQSNKVKQIASFIHYIHAVDSIKLLESVNAQAEKYDRIISCLLQFHIAEEETKFGFSKEEGSELLQSIDWNQLKNVRIAGVMGMATQTDNKAQISKEFGELKNIFKALKNNHFKDKSSFQENFYGHVWRL